MLALLAEVVNVGRGSHDKAGVDDVGRRFVEFLQSHGLVTSTEAVEGYGDAMHVRLDDTRANERPVVRPATAA